MKYKGNTKEFSHSCWTAFFLALFIIATTLCTFFFLPTQKVIPHTVVSQNLTETVQESSEYYDNFISEVSNKSSRARRGDDGLALYRNVSSRGAVEWFYIGITDNKESALAILKNADKNNIPLSLAFALAYVESRYNVRAVNHNSNSTIDRGLFQLNNNSFPQLSEEDFFNPEISAQYGMSHFRFCLNVAGNEVSALAMYNAGTNRVRSNSTPQSTLNYIGQIMSYRRSLEKSFSDDVLSYYDTSLIDSSVVYEK